VSDRVVARIAGISGLLFLPLIMLGFGALVGFSPTIDADRAEIASYYADLSFGQTMVGEWLEMLAFAGLLVFAAGISWLLRGRESRWLAWLALAAAAALAASVLTGVAPLLAAAYLGDHGGLTDDQFVLLNGVRQAAHWLYSLFAGVWMVASAATLLQARIVPRWLGWAGLVVGLVLVFAVAAPLSGAVDTGQLLMGVWLLAAGGLLALRAPAAP
jgi:Domain of unknown function (DUF4386)